ncbi:MAG: DUF4214 domain-containing protein [Oligoflexia bacterium]|nr:DUF4214 domain-containing protein [Oligoflexia bacterium]
MKNRLLFAAVLLIFCNIFFTTPTLPTTAMIATAYAQQYAQQEEESEGFFKKILRKYLVIVEKFIDYPLAEKFLGKAPDDIRLPEIPEIVVDAKQVVDQKEKKIDTKFSVDEMNKSNYYFVQEIYLATIKRNPREEELDKWLNTLSQGSTREGIYRAIVLGTEYQELEKLKDPPSPKLVTFMVEYLRMFLGLSVDSKTLDGSLSRNATNLYMLKKFSVEKTLELIDIFLAKGQEQSLYDWYAVFSAYLAEKFPNIWSGEIRKSIYKKGHREWASKVYYDWLKAEVIIKLHHVFNSLSSQM